MRVVDPTGEEWEVSRDWFGLPGWSRSESGTDLAYGDWTGLGGDFGDDSGVLVGIALLVVVVLVVLLLVGLLLPLLLFVAGLLVAMLALAARILSLSKWTVTARGRDRMLIWRVRGLLRSRRALHDVSVCLARGEEPAVEGVAGVVA